MMLLLCNNLVLFARIVSPSSAVIQWHEKFSCLNMCWICVMMVGGTVGLLRCSQWFSPPLLHSFIAYTIHTQLICTNRWYWAQHYCILFRSIDCCFKRVELDIFVFVLFGNGGLDEAAIKLYAFLREMQCEDYNMSILAFAPKSSLKWILLKIGRTSVDVEQFLKPLLKMLRGN